MRRQCTHRQKPFPSQSNLNLLLTNFSIESKNSTFSSLTIGSIPDLIYGLFLCRGDISLSDCNSCIQAAIQTARQKCSLPQATVWYETCQIRYSDLAFLGTYSNDQFLRYPPGQNASDPDTFRKNEMQLISNLSHYAAYNSSSPSLFATGQLVYGTDNNKQVIYGLVQCTRDLSRDLCDQCLLQLLGDYGPCCDAQSVGGVLWTSCSFRYDLDKFFQGEPGVSMISLYPSSAPLPSPPAPSPSSPTGEGKRGGNRTIIIISVVISVVVAIILIIVACIFLRRRLTKDNHGMINSEDISGIESIYYDLYVLKIATANFAEVNKLGQGGFGAVYKGTLPNGQDIAVKKLSANSKQGIQELKNELLLVAKLQHRNLVRLRGICLEGGEKLLVYEYMPGGSLDKFLFDHTKRYELNWERRFNIIGGIARGLLYLHEESHLKVIHRDLKASNVLLDVNLKPKISDFGLARLFGGHDTHAITSRVVGTLGYMAPEYARRGQFSTKLDVYSYGILVLEIVTGRRNSSFKYDSERGQDLLSYTWQHWRNGTTLEIIDRSLGGIYSRNEAFRCIQIALLCTQELPANRPSMSLVFLMLNSPSMPLQDPSQPQYLADFSMGISEVSSKESSKQSYFGSADNTYTSSIGSSQQSRPGIKSNSLSIEQKGKGAQSDLVGYQTFHDPILPSRMTQTLPASRRANQDTANG